MGRINVGGVNKRTGDNINVANSVVGTTLKLTPPKGYYDGSTGRVTITNANFTAGNIKTGINLFGVTGTAYDWSPVISESATNYTTTLLSQTSNISEGSLWRTAGGVSSESFNIDNVVNGFTYTATTTTNSKFPFFSGSFGASGGLYLYSVATGETFQLIPPSTNTGQQTCIRSLSVIRLSSTTVRIHATVLPNGSSSAQNTIVATRTNINPNFFNTSVRLRMEIGACYSNSSSTVFQAELAMLGYMTKF